MAWMDVCKIEASAQIDKLKKDGNGVKDAINTVSTESGIPKGTLRRWYYNIENKPRIISDLHAKPGHTDTCTIADLSQLIESGQHFGTIYADPPWRYSNQSTRAATDDHYDTMTPTEIAALPIAQLTPEKAHLHLWTTNAFLFECPKIIEAWGFEYKGVFVWTKPQMGIGNYWRVSHEFLILGVKGGEMFYDKSQKSWIEANRTKHSVKPDIIAEIIEKVSPGPYLELFGRRLRPNWTVWGNEIERGLFNQ